MRSLHIFKALPGDAPEGTRRWCYRNSAGIRSGSQGTNGTQERSLARKYGSTGALTKAYVELLWRELDP